MLICILQLKKKNTTRFGSVTYKLSPSCIYVNFKKNATLSSAKTDDFLNVLAQIHKMLHNLVNVLMLQLIQIFFGIIFITFEFFILKLPKTIAVYVKLQIKFFLFFYFQFIKRADCCFML